MTDEQKATRWANRCSDTMTVVAALPDGVRPYAVVVGKWVWVTFPAMPSAEVREGLTLAGFTWNGKRRCWQHPCGWFRPGAPYDPREKYGEVLVSDLEANERRVA